MRRHTRDLMDPIRRGTTPMLFFKTPYETRIIESGTIFFSQRGEPLFEKSFEEDCVYVDDRIVRVELTAQETMSLTTYDTCKAQILFNFVYDKKGASGVYDIPVLEILEGGDTHD